MQSVDWDIFRYVVAIADSGSAVAAASRLGVNPTTVIRRISRFETENGIRLFDRGQDGFTPTVECEMVLDAAREMERSVSEIGRNIIGRDFRLEGALTVTTTDTLLVSVLASSISDFCQMHPRIVVDVTVTNRRLNLTRHDADVAIRASIKPPEMLFGQRVSGLAFAVYAAIELTDTVGEAADFEALLQKPWIGFGETFSGSPVDRWVGKNIPVASISVKADTFTAIRDCACAGAGLAVLPCALGDPADELVRVYGPLDDAQTSVWVLTHRDIKAAARIKAFTDHVAKSLRAQSDLLEGRHSKGASHR